MEFHEIINAKLSKEADRPIMQKEAFPVNKELRLYLENYGRDEPLPVSYDDLLYYSHANSLRDQNGKLTHWETAIYDAEIRNRLDPLLVETYAVLKSGPRISNKKNIEVACIDFCEFGNSVPFRIKVRYKNSGLAEVFYIKMADASRIYGLELEHLLSPNGINFLCNNNTLVEEHIEGIPGDVFLKGLDILPEAHKVLLAKEFVQFNERCFIRLLGDMRSYNFAVAVDGDNENVSYRIRAIDFDQQCYEGKKNLYLPQFYRENCGFVDNVFENLDRVLIKQYQTEERVKITFRLFFNRRKIIALLNSMDHDEISEDYKVRQLRRELNEHFNTHYFTGCKTMGTILKRQLKYSLKEKKSFAAGA